MNVSDKALLTCTSNTFIHNYSNVKQIKVLAIVKIVLEISAEVFIVKASLIMYKHFKNTKNKPQMQKMKDAGMGEQKFAYGWFTDTSKCGRST